MELSLSSTSVTQVECYDGRDLGSQPHITVLTSCKVENNVVTMPLLRLLNRKYPKAQIDFWGTETTRDCEIALYGKREPHNWRISWDQPEDNDSPRGRLKAITAAGIHHKRDADALNLVINYDGLNHLTQTLSSWLERQWVAGGSLKANDRSSLPWGNEAQQYFLGDTDWDSEAYLERYSGTFKSNYIAGLLCRVAYLETCQKGLEQIDLTWTKPSLTNPTNLIHATTTRAIEIWHLEQWNGELDWCSIKTHEVGMVEKPPENQQADYHAGDDEERLLEIKPNIVTDLREETSLIEVANACKQAAAVVSVDTSPMHVADAVSYPTLAVVGRDLNAIGASPIRLWQRRSHVIQRTVSNESCTLRNDNRFKNDGCIEERNLDIKGVSVDHATRWLEEKLQ